MTELLYQTNAYLKEFSAVVADVDRSEKRVSLDRTAFYPGGGGQPCDLGVLATWPVIEVSSSRDRVWHRLETGELPAVGDSVSGELDWQRRYLLMRTHSALHVLCGVVWRDLGAKVTGGNMTPGTGRLDFELAGLSRDLIGQIETSCNKEIDTGREVRVGFLSRAEAESIPDLIRTKVNLLPKSITTIRTIALVGLDTQADGGTHVANTGEIGKIRISKYKSKGAINKRLYLEIAPHDSAAS